MVRKFDLKLFREYISILSYNGGESAINGVAEEIALGLKGNVFVKAVKKTSVGVKVEIRFSLLYKVLSWFGFSIHAKIGPKVVAAILEWAHAEWKKHNFKLELNAPQWMLDKGQELFDNSTAV